MALTGRPLPAPLARPPAVQPGGSVAVPSRRGRRGLLRLIRRNPLAAAGLALVIGLGLLAVFPDQLALRSPTEMTPLERLRPPGLDHPFGTDEFGRDLYSRVVHGARISLLAGLSVVVLAAAVGTAIGAVAGYAGNRIEAVLMRLTDLFLAFPFLILALAIVAVLGRSMTNAVLGLALVWWAQYARLVRSQVLVAKALPFVEAARSVGATTPRIVLLHVLPSAISTLLVKASLDIGQVILATASLSFLGLGAAPPTPEWGALITDARAFLQDAWWYPTFPGLAIVVAVLGFNLLGDGIRDYLDPRVRF